MNAAAHLLAFDLGAESGRAIVGRFHGGRLALSECHRFANRPVQVNGTLYWNALGLFREILDGFRAAVDQAGELRGVGVDTWAVDFGILGRDGQLLGNPVHYRDERNAGMMEKVFQRIPRRDVFRRTGIQFLPFNTIYQLMAMKQDRSPQLRAGKRLLLMSDLLNYFLSGVQANEYSNASSTQLCDPRSRQWDRELIEELGLPGPLFGEIVSPGTVLGPVSPTVAAEVGLREARKTSVVASLGHDTAAAVAAVPAQEPNWCFISSGTWSLMGAEISKPCLTRKALAHNFTNEGGLNGTVRFLKNIAGLWLLQQSRGQFAREGREYTYAQLAALAKKAKPLRSLVNPDHPDFLPPGDMATRIAAQCRAAGEPVPESHGAMTRCILESLAMRYRLTLENLQDTLGRRFEVIHIVGGGCQNDLLNQMTADATGVPVVAGPVEATAIGNLLTTALALGVIESPQELRQVVSRSFATRRFEPRNGEMWAKRYERFLQLAG